MSEFFQGGRGGGRLLIYLVLIVGGFLFISGAFVIFATKKGGSSETEAQPIQPVVVREVAPVQPASQMVEVIVPARDIPQGEALQISNFVKVSRPSVGLPLNAVRSYEELQGKYARYWLAALQPVTANAITKEQPVNVVADSIPKGYRAVTISVSATSGVEGWASPGAQVDVQWISDALGERTVVLLVQNAKVLSAERRVDTNAAANNGANPVPTTVTLLVSERDAQKISLAAVSGSIVLHLRGTEGAGKASGSTSTLSVNDVLHGRSSHERENRQVQGTLKIHGSDGKVDEVAIIDGKIMKKVN